MREQKEIDASGAAVRRAGDALNDAIGEAWALGLEIRVQVEEIHSTSRADFCPRLFIRVSRPV